MILGQERLYITMGALISKNTFERGATEKGAFIGRRRLYLRRLNFLNGFPVNRILR